VRVRFLRGKGPGGRKGRPYARPMSVFGKASVGAELASARLHANIVRTPELGEDVAPRGKICYYTIHHRAII
jgi:hypothetical protein